MKKLGVLGSIVLAAAFSSAAVGQTKQEGLYVGASIGVAHAVDICDLAVERARRVL